MATEQKQDTGTVARTYFDAIRRRDLDAMVAIWQPGGIDNLNGMAELRVPEEFRRWFGNLFAAFPDFEMTVLDVVADGELAAVRWRATATFNGSGRFEGLRPTGAAIDITGLDLLTVSDGRLQHNEAYVNGTELARQLGALPAEGSLQERGMLGAVNLRTRASGLLRR